uniref:Uncharacterized protein n=1 Tax=Arundo donax TaxID=35708 RepID=A0A0A9FPY5_ARUDO
MRIKVTKICTFVFFHSTDINQIRQSLEWIYCNQNIASVGINYILGVSDSQVI